jgi:Ca2+-binding RTX toxin-like protein
MRRTIILFLAGILMLALAAGAALAVLRVGNDNPHTLYGTTGDNKGQDTLFGLGTGDKLIGRSAAYQLAGGPGNDRLEGNDGNDTLDGGRGRDLILTGRGFDFVYAEDGYRDTINCNGQSDYTIVFDRFDDLDRCPGANTNAKSATADAVGTEGTADEAMEVWNIK